MFIRYELILLGIGLVGGLYAWRLSAKKDDFAETLGELVIGMLVGGTVIIAILGVVNWWQNPATTAIDPNRPITVITKQQVKKAIQNDDFWHDDTTFILKDGRKVRAKIAMWAQQPYEKAVLVKATLIKRIPSRWVPFKANIVRTVTWVKTH